MEDIKRELAQSRQEKEQEKARNSALLEEVEKLTIVSEQLQYTVKIHKFTLRQCCKATMFLGQICCSHIMNI